MCCYSQVSTGVADMTGPQEMPLGHQKRLWKTSSTPVHTLLVLREFSWIKVPPTYFPSLHLPYARGGLTRKREGGNTQKGQELGQGKGLHYAHHHRERLGAPKGAWPELEFKGKGMEQGRRRKKQRQRWRESPPAKMSHKNKFKTQWRNRNGHDSVSPGYVHENPWRVLHGQDRGFAEMPGSFLLLAMGSDICYLIALSPCSLLCKPGIIKMLSYFPLGVSTSIKWEETVSIVYKAWLLLRQTALKMAHYIKHLNMPWQAKNN